MRTRWPLMVLLFVIPGAALTYWSPEMISSSAPLADEPSVQAVSASAAIASPAPQEGWQAMPARYDATKVATVSFHAPTPVAADEPAAETQASVPAASASSQAPSNCRKYLKPLHLPKAAPKAKAVGLLDQPDNAAKVDPNRAVAILNQRILKADECLKRAGPGS